MWHSKDNPCEVRSITICAWAMFFARAGEWKPSLYNLKVFTRVNQPALVTGTLDGMPVNSRELVSSVVQRFSISHGVNLLMANAVFRQQLARRSSQELGRVMLALHLGAGTTIPHAESTIQGHADEHYQVGSPVIQAAAGVEMRLWRKLYWTGEYKFTRTREQVNVFSGTARSLLESHHLVTGPVIHF